MIATIWLVKLLLAHLLTDFVLQPTSWVAERKLKHFASVKLYIHCIITAAVPFALTGFYHWGVALTLLGTHILIDGWKSYQKPTLGYFVADQFLHIAVIIGCWYTVFFTTENVVHGWLQISNNLLFWKILCGLIFITTPAGIFIGECTKQWQSKIDNADSLANAGKWIGIIERLIVLILVLKNEYAAISLLLAAKAIIRFNEKDRPEIKTEYLVIGTLLSIGIAMATGLLIKYG